MNTKVYTFNKSDISIDDTGKFTYKCSADDAKDLKTNYNIDVQDQTILRHALYQTVDGKVSFTVPNKILKNR